MMFPKQPSGMDTAFYKQLLAWAMSIEREIDHLQGIPRTTPPVEIPVVNEYPLRAPAKLSTASNQAFNVDDLGRHWEINATGNFDLTLPAPVEGGWIGLYNYGGSTITVKNNGGTSIGTLAQYEGVVIQCVPNSSGVQAWPVDITELGGFFDFTLEPSTA